MGYLKKQKQNMESVQLLLAFTQNEGNVQEGCTLKFMTSKIKFQAHWTGYWLSDFFGSTYDLRHTGSSAPKLSPNPRSCNLERFFNARCDIAEIDVKWFHPTPSVVVQSMGLS